jgi:sn-glycerol 3-phosphate transport system permease protein
MARPDGGNRAKRQVSTRRPALRTAALPDELIDASKMDGAGPIRFFEMLLPLSRNNLAALFTIMFVWSWNEYLWPLLVTSDPAHRTAIIGLRELAPGTNGIAR